MTTSNIYNMADTWSDGSTYTAIKMNVTDTSSNAASLLVDLQVGGSSKFSVSKAGAGVLASLALGGASIGTTALAVTGTELHNGATITSGSIFSYAGTWNAAVTFPGALAVNVTATSSNALSELLTLSVGGTAKAGVVKDGSIYTSTGIWGSAATSFNGSNYFGMSMGSNTFTFYSAGNIVSAIGPASFSIARGTAIPAGGTNGTGLAFSTATNFGVYFGSGAPSLSAAKGSLYLRSDGSGIADRIYVATDAVGGWTAIATAA